MNPPTEGDVLAGKYRIERVLGVGGMGMVVSALHLQLEERVAIKFLLPEALANPEAVARFGREARAAVKIKSEHVARVIDVGVLENGAPYMVMELMRGQDLSQVLTAHGAMPVAMAVEYVLQACEALAEAHALGIVHRDLKPANLFLTTRADGSACIKVLDFGISKVTVPSASGSDMGMTRTQAIMGSPLYMSPEQMASARDVDQRSDVWAMGTVLYELVTGRVPFEAETMPQLCAQILSFDPPLPRSVRPDLPDALDQVIMRCLRKDRNQRYSDVAALAADLAHFAPDAGPRSAARISRVLSSSGVALRPSVASDPSALVAASSTGAAWANTQATRGRRAVWLGLLGVAAASIAGVVVWKTAGARPTPPPDISTAPALGKAPSDVPAASAPPPPPSALVAVTSAAPLAASPEPALVAPSAGARNASTKKAPRGAAKPKARPDANAPGVDPLSERN
jgi:serine/threonine-protein kinase